VISRANRVHANPALWGANLPCTNTSTGTWLLSPRPWPWAGQVVQTGSIRLRVRTHTVGILPRLFTSVDNPNNNTPQCTFTSYQLQSTRTPSKSHLLPSQPSPIPPRSSISIAKCNGCNPGIIPHAHHMQGPSCATASSPSRSKSNSPVAPGGLLGCGESRVVFC